MAEPSEHRNSSTQLLQELEALSQSLYHSHNTRRTASLALPPGRQILQNPNDGNVQTTAKNIQDNYHESFDQSSSRRPRLSTSAISSPATDAKSELKGRSRRMSLSPWRSRPKEEEDASKDQKLTSSRSDVVNKIEESAEKKKGLRSWKAIRAISHIGMQKLSCLFSVEIITVQGLPASMNGLRLAVYIRKQETKDGAVQTMPARVLQGAADFEETLFIKCHVYCSGKHNLGGLKFESRPFIISVIAVDAEELDFGKNFVDLSHLIQESMEKSYEGMRIRQWDTSFELSGKAKGGELVLKLGFQIMEKDGAIYNQWEKKGRSSSSFARKQSKNSFSVPSSSHGTPKISHRFEASTPSQRSSGIDFSGMDELNLDEPPPLPPAVPDQNQNKAPPAQEQEMKIDDNDLDLPDFDVVDKGIEIQTPEVEEESSEAADEGSVSTSSEVVKEVVHDPVHQLRLSELDSIAMQIKALESVIGEEDPTAKDEMDFQQLDADEETVTREFLQMLEEEEEIKELKVEFPDVSVLNLEGDAGGEGEEAMVFLPDLGKSLGPVVQTKDGGFLTAMNPLDVQISRKESPKLAMQISKPVVFSSQAFEAQGFELLQKLAAMGADSLTSEVLSVMGLDEITGKTAEQVAFEGIASAIISGRNKEGASSSAARSIATLKTLAAAMNSGRKERISTGIWNVSETPVALEEVLAFALPKIETMSVEALKIQAQMSDEEPPFDVSPITGKTNPSTGGLLATAVSPEEWLKKGGGDSVTMALLVQLRDPLRRYEQVGAPIIVLVFASRVESEGEEEMRFKVGSVVVSGLNIRREGRRHVWNSEKQRLTAAQWLVAYGLTKSTAKRAKHVPEAKVQDSLWSISARVMADMWLKPTRNPDVKFLKP